MLNFKEYIDFSEMTDEEVEEALDMRARMKIKQAMRKNKGKIQAGKKRAANRMASPEKLKARAIKHARTEIEKKILKGGSKADLSFAARGALEKKVDGKKSAIARMSKKLLPSLKRAERAKRQEKD